MAFVLVKMDDSSYPPIVNDKLMADNEAPAFGEGLVESSGRLTKCGATATPEYIALAGWAAEATSVTNLPCIRVSEMQMYEVKSSATVATSVIGSKVTLDSNALLCTATTSSGVFYVDYTDGATTNSTVRGHFRR